MWPVLIASVLAFAGVIIWKHRLVHPCEDRNALSADGVPEFPYTHINVIESMPFDASHGAGWPKWKDTYGTPC